MKVKKALNNNVVIAFEPKRGEIVVMGTGIGFHAKQGDLIDESKIQKIFTENDNKKLMELIEQIPATYLELTEKIVKFSTDYYHMKLQEGIYLLLTDHIYFALKRIKEGWDIDNPFLIDIKHFYQEEYQVGLYAKEEIKNMYQIEIPDTEVGYISMHIVQSHFGQDRRDFTKIFQVINMSVDFLKENLPSVEENTLSYMRMVNHVKHFAKRYVEDKENDTNDNLLAEIIQGAFKEEVDCVNSLSELLLQKFGREITVSEKIYLILHLRNCKEIID